MSYDITKILLFFFNVSRHPVDFSIPLLDATTFSSYAAKSVAIYPYRAVEILSSGRITT
jgi:hypothetical protein